MAQQEHQLGDGTLGCAVVSADDAGLQQLQAGFVSAHFYGTTFDVSWARYTKVDEEDTLNIDRDRLKMVLAMVLRDLRRADRCYVKHERRQGCFHITARE